MVLKSESVKTCLFCGIDSYINVCHVTVYLNRGIEKITSKTGYLEILPDTKFEHGLQSTNDKI